MIYVLYTNNICIIFELKRTLVRPWYDFGKTMV
jgi:hypothetical protein